MLAHAASSKTFKNTAPSTPVPKVEHTLAHVLLQLVDAPVLPQQLAFPPKLHCRQHLDAQDVAHREAGRIISLRAEESERREEKRENTERERHTCLVFPATAASTQRRCCQGREPVSDVPCRAF